MGVYDFQVHTDASPCSAATPRRIVSAALRSGLDGIAVTDHDTMANVEAVQDVAPPKLTVIPGVEVTTTQGHLLAFDVEDPPPTTDPIAVISDVHEQNGLAVLSHPFDILRESYDESPDSLLDAADGIEVINSRCLLPQFNERARKVAEEHSLALTGGSDAHFSMEVGRAHTVCPTDWDEAIRTNATVPEGRGGYISGHVATKIHQFSKLVGFD